MLFDGQYSAGNTRLFPVLPGLFLSSKSVAPAIVLHRQIAMRHWLVFQFVERFFVPALKLSVSYPLISDTKVIQPGIPVSGFGNGYTLLFGTMTNKVGNGLFALIWYDVIGVGIVMAGTVSNVPVCSVLWKMCRGKCLVLQKVYT